jgi:uroporphyrinogen decarboxylase
LDIEAEKAFEDGYAVALASPTGGILEVSMWLRGSQKFLLDLIVNKRFAKALMDKICKWYIEFFDAALDVVKDRVQIVSRGDDLGTQKGPMISSQLYREMVKPFHIKVNKAIKRKGDFYINFHSCGSIRKLLPDIIETGVDAINPVQVSAKDMDTKALKGEFGDKITFWGGGCDNQRVLPYGNPKDVENEVKKRISDLAPRGGYIFAPIHNIQAEVPPQNIVAMFEAANIYGKYPIKIESLEPK